MTQPSLLEMAERAPLSDTSLMAYDRLLPTLAEREWQVLAGLHSYLKQTGFPDATGGELACFLGLDRTQVRPRLTALLKAGVIEKAPTRRSRDPFETFCHGHRPCVPLAALERAKKDRENEANHAENA